MFYAHLPQRATPAYRFINAPCKIPSHPTPSAQYTSSASPKNRRKLNSNSAMPHASPHNGTHREINWPHFHENQIRELRGRAPARPEATMRENIIGARHVTFGSRVHFIRDRLPGADKLLKRSFLESKRR